MSLPKAVYNKDDCGKLKIKDSYHTRRSKQNTYHVVNKNIAPSKVTDRQTKEGMPSGASPSIGFSSYLNYLGVTWVSPSRWLHPMDVHRRTLAGELIGDVFFHACFHKDSRNATGE